MLIRGSFVMGPQKLVQMHHVILQSRSPMKDRAANLGQRSGHSQQPCDVIVHALGEALKRCVKCGRMEGA
jgi:hypothetical protein